MFNDLFTRAALGQPLTPGERAFRKGAQGLAAAVIVASAPILAAALAQTQPDWNAVARQALAAALTALLLAAMKWATAQGDQVLLLPPSAPPPTPDGVGHYLTKANPPLGGQP